MTVRKPNIWGPDESGAPSPPNPPPGRRKGGLPRSRALIDHPERREGKRNRELLRPRSPCAKTAYVHALSYRGYAVLPPRDRLILRTARGELIHFYWPALVLAFERLHRGNPVEGRGVGGG